MVPFRSVTNLLFDGAYNLTDVLDWSGAGTAPLERLAVSLELITFPGMPDEQKQVNTDFRKPVRNSLANVEGTVPASKTTLSAILGTKRADIIIHRCTYSFLHRALWDVRLVAELIYKDAVSWEQLVVVYGDSELY
ncbi:Protein kinase-like domain protein [Akanthomyces lecanii RCEF 1005]|uniref:Protein kinase-like domain protein n=1 Tax=Akanthomyces lecanii RCEF 1005 TaxID=1081108 RepID=A0A168FVP8_CORDF|nr:Protein kinase-like domain protein [Akanthomyces lecanii RCEF 1005]